MSKALEDETKAWCACGDSIGPGSVGALCADCAFGLERKRDDALARVGQLETLLDGMGAKLGVRTITGLINMLQKADARIVELEAERDAARAWAQELALHFESCDKPCRHPKAEAVWMDCGRWCPACGAIREYKAGTWGSWRKPTGGAK